MPAITAQQARQKVKDYENHIATKFAQDHSDFLESIYTTIDNLSDKHGLSILEVEIPLKEGIGEKEFSYLISYFEKDLKFTVRTITPLRRIEISWK